MEIYEKVSNLKKLVNGYKASQIISSAEQLKIFEVLDKKPIDCNNLSNTLNINCSKLEAILNALVCLNLVSKNDYGFFLDEYYDVLSIKSENNQLGYIRHATTMMNKWTKMAELAKLKEINESNFNDITGKERTSTEAFIQAMNNNALPQAKFISKNYSFEKHKILDIGAGAGTYSLMIGKNYNTAKGVMLDLPAVSKIIQQNIIDSNLEERFNVLEGNYNDTLIVKEKFDDIFLFAVAHQENDENLNKLLEKVYEVLKIGGRLFLSSFFLNEDKISPEFSVMFAIEMLVMSPNGKVYTHSEIQQKLKNIGFNQIERVNEIPSPATLYVATKN